jgi:hypothetical protein
MAGNERETTIFMIAFSQQVVVSLPGMYLPALLRARPYARVEISGLIGISEAQREQRDALGAIVRNL